MLGSVSVGDVTHVSPSSFGAPVGMFVDLPTSITLYTLWLFNIAMENGPFIDDVPSYKPPFIRDFPWLC